MLLFVWRIQTSNERPHGRHIILKQCLETNHHLIGVQWVVSLLREKRKRGIVSRCTLIKWWFVLIGLAPALECGECLRVTFELTARFFIMGIQVSKLVAHLLGIFLMLCFKRYQ